MNLCNKLFVILEDAAVSGVTIEGSEFDSWQTLSQVDCITAGHHSVVFTVDDQDRLLNARQVGRLLRPPSMDGLEHSYDDQLELFPAGSPDAARARRVRVVLELPGHLSSLRLDKGCRGPP